MRFRLAALVLVPLSFLFAQGGGKSDSAAHTISEKTAGMTHLDGFLPLSWDKKSGRMYMQISRFDQDILYLTSLPWGVGSNDLGLDRGQLGHSAVVQFRRIGPKVLLIEPNLAFRSGS